LPASRRSDPRVPDPIFHIARFAKPRSPAHAAVMSEFDTPRISGDVRLESAKWAKPDINQVAVTNSDFMSTRPTSFGFSAGGVGERSRAALGVAFYKTLLAAFDKFWQSDACQTL
jgi:hypothetical protein